MLLQIGDEMLSHFSDFTTIVSYAIEVSFITAHWIIECLAPGMLTGGPSHLPHSPQIIIA